MTEDKNSSSADQLKGSVKEAIGKLIGDVRVEADGRRQKRPPRPSKSTAGRKD